MSLTAYTITALQRDFADSESTGKQIVAGAVCTMTDSAGNAVTMFDDAAGSNGSTAKTTNADGQVTVYVYPDTYTLTTNGINRKIVVPGSTTVEFEAFADMSSAIVQEGQRVICRERANAVYIAQADGYTPLAGDAVDSTGRGLALQVNGSVHVEWFGGDIQDAVDRIDSDGGGRVYAFGYYTITSTLSIPTGIEILGDFPKNVFSSVVPASAGGVIYGDFTSGPMVLVSDGGVKLSNLTIKGGATRRAASITSGAQNTNAGILVEGVDTGSDILQSIVIDSVRCVSQPADGILIEGDVTNISLINCYTNDCGRHGKAMSSGEIGGRTNKELGGIVMIRGGKSFDCGGHGVCIGHPSSTQFPYRITMINHEGYRLALDAAQRYSTAANWIVCQDGDFINCAWGGTTTGNVADHEGLEIGGRDIRVTGCRYINCATNYVILRQQSGFSTKGIEFNGGVANTTGAPFADFMSIAAGPDSISVRNINHDCTSPITDLPFNSTHNNVVLQDIDENKVVHYNYTIDFTDVNIDGLKAQGSQVEIASGSIDIVKQGFYIVDTEAASASDTLTDMVSLSSVYTGDTITIRQENSGRVVTVQDGAGNIRLAGSANYTFPNVSAFLTLMYDGTNWQEISRSEN